MTPVGRHLTSAGGRIGSRADGLLQHLERRDPQSQTQSAVAIIEIEPIVAGTQRHGSGHLHRLMPRAANLKKDAILPLQSDFPVVQTPGGVHDPKRAYQFVGLKPFDLPFRAEWLSGYGNSHAQPDPPLASRLAASSV